MSAAKSPLRIVFVYNAENGAFNAISSSMHRVFSPSTYECSLCFFTHDLTGMNRKWKHFLDSLKCPVSFYYRTEFHDHYPDVDVALPAVVCVHQGGMDVLVSADEIRSSGGLDRLIQLTRLRIDSAVATRSATNRSAADDGSTASASL